MASALAVALFAPYVVAIPLGTSAEEIQNRIDAGLTKRRVGQRLEVRFKSGAYFLDRTLRITGSDVTLIGSKSTTLTGAVSLQEWRPLSTAEAERFPEEARSHLRVCPVPGVLPLGGLSRRGFGLPEQPAHSELFADGKPLTLARYPNLDAPNGGWQLTGEKSPTGYGFKDLTDRPLKWKNPSSAWVYGYWHYDWADNAEPLNTFDASTHEVMIQDLPDANKGGLGEFGLEKGRRFFYLNVPEELDQEGEYWVDTSARKVYAWLNPATKMATLNVSSGPLLTVEKAARVHVVKVNLEGTRGTALRVTDSDGFCLRESVVKNVGGSGVAIIGGKQSGVRNVEVTGCGESGVIISGGNFETLSPAENFVENSLIHQVSRWCRTYHPAVSMDGVGQRIVGNTITDLPHNAILFGGNDHLIERNDIRRVCLETGDSGAIYIGRNPTTRGTIIKNNRFREIDPHTNTEGNYPSVISVYLDDGQCGISIIGNVFESKGIGIMIGGGRDNVVRGNVFIDAQPGISFDQRGKGWAKGEFWGSWEFKKALESRPIGSPIWKARYPSLYRDFNAGLDLALAVGNEVSGNVHVGNRWIDYLDGLTEKNLEYHDNVTGLKATSLTQAIKMVPSKYAKIDLRKIGRRP